MTICAPYSSHSPAHAPLPPNTTPSSYTSTHHHLCISCTCTHTWMPALNVKRDIFGKQALFKWWHGAGGLLDYTNEEAVQWWHGQIDQVSGHCLENRAECSSIIPLGHCKAQRIVGTPLLGGITCKHIFVAETINIYNGCCMSHAGLHTVLRCCPWALMGGSVMELIPTSWSWSSQWGKGVWSQGGSTQMPTMETSLTTLGPSWGMTD